MPTNHLPLKLLIFTTLACAMGQTESVLFRDEFKGRLGEGWVWVRENPAGWRVSDRGLEVRVEPGNMWGGANNAKNVLVRAISAPPADAVAVAVSIENRPTEQYEQVDLVWYYDDSHMVKIGQELVDGKLSIVMGREENDRTRTIVILPLDSFSVRLRLTVKEGRIRGEYQLPAKAEWIRAGECDVPVHGEPKVALQVYQGPEELERWARFSRFLITRPSE